MNGVLRKRGSLVFLSRSSYVLVVFAFKLRYTRPKRDLCRWNEMPMVGDLVLEVDNDVSVTQFTMTPVSGQHAN